MRILLTRHSLMKSRLTYLPVGWLWERYRDPGYHVPVSEQIYGISYPYHNLGEHQRSKKSRNTLPPTDPQPGTRALPFLVNSNPLRSMASRRGGCISPASQGVTPMVLNVTHDIEMNMEASFINGKPLSPSQFRC